MTQQWLALSHAADNGRDLPYILSYDNLKTSIQLTYSLAPPSEWTYTETPTLIQIYRNGELEISATPLLNNTFSRPVHF